MSIELRNKVAELERRVAQLEAARAHSDVPGQVHKDHVVGNVPPEIARATLTLPEKRKSA